MKKIYFLIIVALLIVSLSNSSEALSLSGKSISPIAYVPGASLTNHYVISGTDAPVTITADNTTFSSIKVIQTSPYEFDLLIDFPKEKYIAPGSYNFGVTVTEAGEAPTGVSSRVSVSKSFTVNVYSYTKKIEALLDAPSINQHEQMTFNLYVKSLGYPDIENVHGQIIVYNSSRQELVRVDTESKALPGLGSISFNSLLDTRSWPANNYFAEATVNYDGNIETANTSFLIGQEDISVRNYTRELRRGFSEFTATVRNEWGQPLQNVYATLTINDLEITQTPTIVLDPWSEGNLKNLVRIDFPPDTYDGTLMLYYNDKKKAFPINVRILPSTEEMSQGADARRMAGLLWKVSIVVLAIALLALFLWVFKKRKVGR